MKISSLCLVALIGSTSAFAPLDPSPVKTQFSTTTLPAVLEPDEGRSLPLLQSNVAGQVSSAVATSAMAFMVIAAPTPVDAASSAPPVVQGETVKLSSKKTSPAVAPVPAEKKTLDNAKEAVENQTKRLSELTKEIKAQKIVDSKALAAVNKAETLSARARKTYERENEFLMKMSPKTPVITLQAQKSKVCKCYTGTILLLRKMRR